MKRTHKILSIVILLLTIGIVVENVSADSVSLEAISVKLVNETNIPLKYKNINGYIDEYYLSEEGYYIYKKTYYMKKKTDSTGNTEFLSYLPFKGYENTLYTIFIEYKYLQNDGSLKYTYYWQDKYVNWYISTRASTSIKNLKENLRENIRKNLTKTNESSLVTS